MPTDPLANMSASLVHDDPELRAAVKSLAMEAVTQARYIMERGTPNLKLAVIKVLMPAVARELAKKEDRDDLTQLRAEMSQMFAEMRGDDGVHEAIGS